MGAKQIDVHFPDSLFRAEEVSEAIQRMETRWENFDTGLAKGEIFISLNRNPQGIETATIADPKTKRAEAILNPWAGAGLSVMLDRVVRRIMEKYPKKK